MIFLIDSQHNDELCEPILNYLENKQLPQNDKTARKLLLDIGNYKCIDKVLYRYWYPPGKSKKFDKCIKQLVVPKTLKHTILSANHNDMIACHPGIDRMFAIVRQRFYWDTMADDVTNWVKSCPDCNSRKSPRVRFNAPMKTFLASEPFSHIQIDLVGPLIQSEGDQYKYIFVMIDLFSGWPEAVPLKTADAVSVAEAFYESIIVRHGAPSVVQSDRGQQFLSQIFTALCRYFDIEKRHSVSYRPETNGKVERFNKFLKERLSMYVSTAQTDWPKYLSGTLFSYRLTPLQSTGYSPFFLVYGREATLPIQEALKVPREAPPSTRIYLQELTKRLEYSRKSALDNIKEYKGKMKTRHDQSLDHKTLEVGDQVYIYYPPNTKRGQSKKLMRNWHGPYKIVDKPSDRHVLVRRQSDGKLLPNRIHIQRCKRTYSRYIEPEIDEVPQLSPEELNNDLQQDPDYIPVILDNVGNPDDPQSDTLNNDPPVENRVEDTQHPITGDNPPVDSDQVSQNSSDSDSDPYYEIEKVLKSRLNQKDQREFLIKWKGYNEKTWENVDNLNEFALEYVRTHTIPEVKSKK